MKFGKLINYGVTIHPTHNEGFIVKVGCAEFSFTNKNDLLIALEEYLDNPGEYEKEYNKVVGQTAEPDTGRAETAEQPATGAPTRLTRR